MQCFFRQAIPLMIGLWPLPSPALALTSVLELSEMRPLRHALEADFGAGLELKQAKNNSPKLKSFHIEHNYARLQV